MRGRSDSGCTLVALVVLVTIMNVLVAAALPSWSKVIQRQKEEELIFRGLQYAEAIRVFQIRHGRLPVKLEELLEVEPRSIRQLWRDPFNEEGGWGLILAAQGAGSRQVGGAQGNLQGRLGAGSRASGGATEGQPQAEPIVGLVDPARRRPGGGRVRRVAGPIKGVYSLADGDSIKVFNGSTSYKQWKFTTDLMPVSAGPGAGENVPRMSSKWIGRPFPDGVAPEQAAAPGLEDPKQEEEEQERKGRRGRSRSRRSRDSGQPRGGGRSDG